MGEKWKMKGGGWILMCNYMLQGKLLKPVIGDGSEILYKLCMTCIYVQCRFIHV